MALRFFLGIFETVYGPGVPFYLSFLYSKSECLCSTTKPASRSDPTGRRDRSPVRTLSCRSSNSNRMYVLGLRTTIVSDLQADAGALAYGITHIKNAALPDWRILFLIEQVDIIAAPKQS